MKQIVIVLFVVLCALFLAADDWKMGDTTRAPVETVSSTSELEEVQFGGQYVYPPAYVLDGNFMTTWSEAAKGPGIGHGVTIGFARPVSFDEIQIANGLAGTRNYYFANNRVTKLRIIQKAGKHFQSQDFNLKDGVVGWQSVRFALPQTAEQIIFRIEGVAKGSKYDDTCIADIRFLYKGRVIPYSGHQALIVFQEKMAREKVQQKSAAISVQQFREWYLNKSFQSGTTGLTYRFNSMNNDGSGSFFLTPDATGGDFQLRGGRLILKTWISYVQVNRVLYFRPQGPGGFLLNGVLYTKEK